MDQGSGVEIIYPDLTGYDSPLLGFDGKVVFLKG